MYIVKTYLQTLNISKTIREKKFQIPPKNFQSHREIIHHNNIIKTTYFLFKR